MTNSNIEPIQCYSDAVFSFVNFIGLNDISTQIYMVSLNAAVNAVVPWFLQSEWILQSTTHNAKLTCLCRSVGHKV